MDNMAAGWDRPQEDEFALMNLGLPSPYRHIAFACEEPVDLNYLDFQDVNEAELRKWLQALRRFLLGVSTVTGRPLVIKSPTHTGRIAVLANEFPDARFIHVTRDPCALFPSTCRLWESLADAQGLQVPRKQTEDENAGTELSADKQYVIDCLRRMYDSFLRDRKTIDDNRIVDIRYEDLVSDPVATLDHVYRSLRLSDFDSVRPVIEAWSSGEHRSYKTNRHELSGKDEAAIRSAWKHYFETYGY
jgi:hypothetical protein